MHYIAQYLQPFIDHFGCTGVGIIIFFESMGLPLPAESLLIATVLYSVKSHHIDINTLAITTVIAAIAGDSVGYFVGYKIGSKAIAKLASKIHIKPINFVTARYLFRKFGGIVVFFGRFAALMRVVVPLVAGSLEMPWHRFLFFNALGGIVWGCLSTYGIYYGGLQILSLPKPIIFAAILFVFLVFIAFAYITHHYFKFWSKQAVLDLSEEEKNKFGINS